MLRAKRTGLEPGVPKSVRRSRREASAQTSLMLSRVLCEAAEGYIFDDSDKQYFQNEVSVFDRSKPNLQSTVSMPESNWTPLSAAREKFQHG